MTRDDFALLCNRKNLLGNALEIGIHTAIFSTCFLRQWKGAMYTCVDPWIDYCEDFITHDRSCDFAIAMNALSRFNDRIRVLRLTSEEAIKHVNYNFDFIYIDGDHSLPMVTQDIALWWPKLHRGGIFAGHDFNIPWVRDAVTAHATANGIPTVFLTHEPAMSWFFYKT